MISKLTKLFPLWAILFALIGYLLPQLFTSLKSMIIPLLMLIMLSMGITLTFDDFVRVFKNPKVIFVGVILQYLLMPAVAYFISIMLNLSSELLVGMVLVGSVSGGTASNVICYLAKADVALSISMTIFSTLVAFVATPYLTYLYAGEYIPIPVTAMILSIIKIVILPLFLGILINKFLSKKVEIIKSVLPFISMIAIIAIIAIVVALNNERIGGIGLSMIVAVILHNLIGVLSGYSISKLLNYDEKVCRTIAIEVGMQNSGLAVALASKYFTPLASLPGAIFSIWHNISGSLLAGFWSKRDLK